MKKENTTLAKWVKTLVINENYDDFLFGIAFYKIIFKALARKQSTHKSNLTKDTQRNRDRQRE